MEKEKPSLDQVIKYGTPLIKKFLRECASALPVEQKKEIMQEAYLRLVNHYSELDPNQGWKSYVYTHAKGAVFDYLKGGKGFHEQRWSIQKEEDHGSQNVSKIKDRLSNLNKEGKDQQVDKTLASNGKFSEFDSGSIHWDLVARMASIDEPLHAFAMHLLDFSQEEIAPKFAACRTSVGGLLQAFLERFDSPEHADCEWFKQTCRAFGIADRFNISEDPKRYPIGWALTPVDLFSLKPLYPEEVQMDLFGEEGEH